MKIRLNLKDPDGVYNSVDEATKESVAEVQGVSDDEREELQKSRREEIEESIRKWVRYSEYLSVEIDTDAQTARVLDA